MWSLIIGPIALVTCTIKENHCLHFISPSWCSPNTDVKVQKYKNWTLASRVQVRRGSLVLEQKCPVGRDLSSISQRRPSCGEPQVRSGLTCPVGELAWFLFHNTSLSCSKTTGCEYTESSRELSGLSVFSSPRLPEYQPDRRKTLNILT